MSHSKRINYYCSLCASFHLFPDSHIHPTIQPGVLPLFMMCVMMLYPILFQMRSWMSFSLSLCSLLFILTGKWRLKGKANGLNLFYRWRFSRIASKRRWWIFNLLFSKLQYIYKTRYLKCCFPFSGFKRKAGQANSLVSLLSPSKYKGYIVTKYMPIKSDSDSRKLEIKKRDC